MAHSSIVVANRFIELAERSGQKLTNMQLQKLVFLAHGVALALTDNALTFHNIHAWQWGPVIPQLYKRFSAYGSAPITAPAACQDEPIKDGSTEAQIVNLVWEKFGGFSGPKLSAITHEPGSPWDITWNTDKWGIIPTALIQDFYKKQLNVAKEQTESQSV